MRRNQIFLWTNMQFLPCIHLYWTSPFEAGALEKLIWKTWKISDQGLNNEKSPKLLKMHRLQKFWKAKYKHCFKWLALCPKMKTLSSSTLSINILCRKPPLQTAIMQHFDLILFKNTTFWFNFKIFVLFIDSTDCKYVSVFMSICIN